MSELRPAGIADTDTYITRSFDAPRDLVWKFWLDPEHLARWWGPLGYHCPIEEIVLERAVGGRFKICMVNDETGEVHLVTGEVLELEPPSVLALDMHANVGSATYPQIDAQLRVIFHDHGDRTRVTLHQGPFAATEIERGNSLGWSQSLDTLATLLADHRKGTRP